MSDEELTEREQLLLDYLIFSQAMLGQVMIFVDAIYKKFIRLDSSMEMFEFVDKQKEITDYIGRIYGVETYMISDLDLDRDQLDIELDDAFEDDDDSVDGGILG